ncbi:MAG: asparagine synthase-related protein [bacterium]|nr:asparagine synthase-related protein [bacterium]
MYCVIGEGNRIEYSSIPLKEGLNSIGTVYGIAALDYALSDIKGAELLQDVSPTRFDGKGMFICVRDGRFVWASPDISGIRDVFYAIFEDEKQIVGDDFFEIVSQIRSVTLNADTTAFFIRQGYFPPGATFFQEVSRVRVGTKLTFAHGKAVEENAWESEEQEKPRTYEAFKDALSSVLKVREVSDEDAIFLSAGVDSGLLAALSAKTFHKHPLAITMRYKQTLKINEIDAVGSERIARHLGLEHVAITFDFDEEHPSSLKGFIERMPLAAHMAVTFLKMSREVAKRGKTKVWCGQNADSLYNLGPTEKTLGGPIKRFYLSKEYWKSFPDIKDKSAFGFLWRWVGALGPPSLRLKRGFQMRQPSTFHELLHAFEESEEYIALPSATQKPEQGASSEMLSYAEAKRLFFDRKAQSFIIGRDPRAVYAAGEQEHVEVILPYSAANMVHFFRGLELGIRDVFWPKRYIYRYLQELLGASHFNSLYGSQERFLPQVQYLNWQEWQKKTLFRTSFWNEIREEVKENPIVHALEKKSSPFFNKNSLYHIINLYWMQSVLRKIEDGGVAIKIAI